MRSEGEAANVTRFAGCSPSTKSCENGSFMASAASSKLTSVLRGVARTLGIVPLEVAVHDRRHERERTSPTRGWVESCSRWSPRTPWVAETDGACSRLNLANHVPQRVDRVELEIRFQTPWCAVDRTNFAAPLLQRLLSPGEIWRDEAGRPKKIGRASC